MSAHSSCTQPLHWMHSTHFSPGLLLEYSSTHTKHISSSSSSHPWLSWFFLDVLGIFFLAFLGCLLPSANLFGFGFCFFSCLLLIWHLFLVCQSRLLLYHLVVQLLQPVLAKLVQLIPNPPTWHYMLVLTYQHNNWRTEAYSHAAK